MLCLAPLRCCSCRSRNRQVVAKRCWLRLHEDTDHLTVPCSRSQSEGSRIGQERSPNRPFLPPQSMEPIRNTYEAMH